MGLLDAINGDYILPPFNEDVQLVIKIYDERMLKFGGSICRLKATYF
jgi:hypothetical protein